MFSPLRSVTFKHSILRVHVFINFWLNKCQNRGKAHLFYTSDIFNIRRCKCFMENSTMCFPNRKLTQSVLRNLVVAQLVKEISGFVITEYSSLCSLY
jgi:hypothetical protein